MSSTFFILLELSILAYALVAGVFLAFSDFIMRSLALTGGAGGVEAMQVINREVFRWVFMALFIGMAAVSLVIVGYARHDVVRQPLPVLIPVPEPLLSRRKVFRCRPGQTPVILTCSPEKSSI